MALNLHGFYGGLERLFGRIAVVVDGSLPEGPHWHQALLKQMAEDLPGLRPAVLSSETAAKLDEYRAFRHVVRNLYTVAFQPERLKVLVGDVLPLFEQVRTELFAFATFLEGRR